MGAFTIGGFFCLLAIVQWVLKRMSNAAVKGYPDGPKPLGIFGNAFLLKRLQSCPDRELASIARDWGDICMIWAARFPILIINKPNVAKELLVDVRSYPTVPQPLLLVNILQRGHMYSSRPEPNSFRSSIWPWRLPIISAGEQFRYLRKLYQSLLSSQRAIELRKYQDLESVLLINDLLDRPQDFFEDVDRYAMSVIFSAVYGIRISKLNHPITAELSDIWLLMLQRESTAGNPLRERWLTIVQIYNQVHCLLTILLFFKSYRSTSSQDTNTRYGSEGVKCGFISPFIALCVTRFGEVIPRTASANISLK